jgi:pyruvate dehydrogenase E2 component (dihydrolipoamide acetyltransferase)
MEVKLPKLGENAEGGVVVSVLIREGDTVTKGQTILELENEKAVAPIPSSGDGVVASLRVKEGDRLTVGQVIAVLTPTGGAAPAPTAAPAKAAAPAAPKARTSPPPAPNATPAPAEPEAVEEAAPDAPLPPASPEIRRVARELGIDLRRVHGSESGGRVVFADLREYIKRLESLASRRAAPAVTSPAPGPAPASVAPTAEPIDFAKWGAVSRQPLTILRRTISRRMAENWNTIPHVTQFDEADITELMELRKRFAPAYEQKGARLTLTSFALKAVVAALRKHPIFNSSLDEASQELVLKQYYHIGLAVDTEQGLIVPVLRDADRKSLFELSQEVSAMAEKARARKVTLEELKGGSFTISNQGGIGSGHFTPIINKPEVAILGLGKGALKPVVREGQIAQRLLLPIAVSYDHRLIDGGTAARFTVDLVEALQAFKEADVALV